MPGPLVVLYYTGDATPRAQMVAVPVWRSRCVYFQNCSKAPKTPANATGARISTDGMMSELQLATAKTRAMGTPQLTTR